MRRDATTLWPLWTDRWIWGAVAFFTGSGATTIRTPDYMTKVTYGA